MYSSSHNTCINIIVFRVCFFYATNAFSPIMFDGALIRECSKGKMSQFVFVFFFTVLFKQCPDGWVEGRTERWMDRWIEPKLMLTDKFRRC